MKHGEKLKDKDTIPGTPLWMAPEVLMGRPLDEKSDVYAFAVVLWEIGTCAILLDAFLCCIFRLSFLGVCNEHSLS